MANFLFLFVLLAASTILSNGLALCPLLLNDPVYAPPSDELALLPPGDIQAFLNSHNTIRAKHGASPLAWDAGLASKAEQWAARCQFKHSGGTLGPYGENLAAGTGSAYGIPAAVKSWTDEVSSYNPNNPVPSHFTQVVWKSSKKVGCAVHMCTGIFDPKFGLAKFVVCEYSPPGNVIGRFKENVQV